MKSFGKIQEYIPQGHPFIMVDKLIEVDEEITISTFTVKNANLFCENGKFYEGGLIENMAQTIAAGEGYRLRKEYDSKPKIGVIGAVKNLSIHKRPESGSTLQTQVEKITSFKNALVVKCSVSENGITIADCQMNIFILENQTP